MHFAMTQPLRPQLLHGPFGQTEAEVARASALLEALGRYLVETSEALNRWAAALAYLHAFGAAKCDELIHYNQQAISNYSRQVLIRVKLIEAGLPPSALPEPTLPALFGITASVSAQPDSIFPAFSFQLGGVASCSPKGYALRSVKLHGNLCPVSQIVNPDTPSARSVQGVLGLAPAAAIAACAANPFACAFLGLVAGGAVAVIYLTVREVPGFVRSVLNSEGEINRMMQDTTAKREAARAAAIADCLTKNFAAINALPADKRDAAIDKARTTCEALFPTITAPPPARSPFITIAIASAIVGVTVGGLYLGHYLIERSRQRA